MSLVAKRYVKALSETFDSETLSELSKLFSSLASNFSDIKFRTVLTSNLTSKSDKEKILLESLGDVDGKIINFIKLLIEKGRVVEIPAIAEELRVKVAHQNNSFEGKLFSSSTVDVADLKAIEDGLSQKLGKNIKLTAVKSDDDSVRVVVDDLNINISLSKNRIVNDMINHILKAI